jgi:hypothetical protein
MPPLTSRISPAMYADASDRRKLTASATSSGVPTLHP